MATIGSNQGAVSASNFYLRNNDQFQQSIKRIASGSRIANPSDDAAGVAVSAKLDAVMKRLSAASEGSQNVISLAQTTDGFLNTIQSSLTRMSELAMKATNGTFSDADRAMYNTEFTKLRDQIGTMTSSASFNGTAIFQNSTVSVAINSEGNTDTFNLSTTGDLASLSLGGAQIDTINNAQAAINTLNNAISQVTSRRAEVNADISKFNFNITNARTESVNIQEANSRIKDLNMAEESVNLATNKILSRTSSMMLAQANSSQRATLGLLT
jgi:flagellin